MAYTNKRKIHIARGTSANLLNGAKFAEDKDRIQNAGQPAFIEDKFYLTVGGKSNKRFDEQVPIRVRTVDGYISDTEDLSNNTFQLSSNKSNRYTLTGVKESGTPIVYLNTTDANFDIRRNTTSMLKVDSDKVLINPDKYIESLKINTSYIKSITDGNSKIEFIPHIISNNQNIGADVNNTYDIILKDNTYINSVFTSYYKTNLHGKTNIAGTLALSAATSLSGTITGTTSGKTLTLNPTTGKIEATEGTINTLNSITAQIGTLNMLGKLNFCNNTWNTVGDDIYIGDINQGGALGLIGNNGNTSLFFIKNIESSVPPSTFNASTTNYGKLEYNGTKFIFSKAVTLPGESNISGSLSTSGSLTVGSTLTVNGTGSHQIKGTLKVSTLDLTTG